MSYPREAAHLCTFDTNSCVPQQKSVNLHLLDSNRVIIFGNAMQELHIPMFFCNIRFSVDLLWIECRSLKIQVPPQATPRQLSKALISNYNLSSNYNFMVMFYSRLVPLTKWHREICIGFLPVAIRAHSIHP